MKLISFTVPCYNSEKYLEKCLESLLVAGEDCEILIINDGSTDGTSAIAHEYQERYPSVIRVFDKENGGHGSGVNVGLANATGLYFKVVDSDDWLDEASLKGLLAAIKSNMDSGSPDLYITNLVREKVEEGTNKAYRCKKFFPKNQIFGWDKVKKFGMMDFLIMHNYTYKTEVLRQSGVVLPLHTFYVDNLVAYIPLPFVKTLSYLNLDLYRYYVGRSDQSISAENITKRYRQQIDVMLRMVDAYNWQQLSQLDKGLSRHMKHYLSTIMSLTVMFTTAGKDNKKQRKEHLKAMWAKIKFNDKKMYRFLRYRSVTAAVNWMPFWLQGRVTWLCYKITCGILGYE